MIKTIMGSFAKHSRGRILGSMLLPVLVLACTLEPLQAQTGVTRGFQDKTFANPTAPGMYTSGALPAPYYPQQPQGELRLNYYYDRTGRWVKFSDWIPFKQHKYEPRFLEDFYRLHGLPHHYNVHETKLAIYWLVQALTHRFRHPRNALCKVDTEIQYHKYRNLMFMHINLRIMRMFLRLGSLYDKRHLYFHDLDMADDLEISFLIARSYYKQAIPYWNQARKYAQVAGEYRFTLDLPTIETERFRINNGKLDYDRIIYLHLQRVESKLGMTTAFLDKEGRPRPVKTAIQKDIEAMYDDKFTPSPLEAPVLDPEWKEKPLFGPNTIPVPNPDPLVPNPIGGQNPGQGAP